ncbi:hypothetical protein ACOCJ7_06530 [Knoellia sp. CPCC 206453]|uniref:hypothetical protein n=1 Tax=Knoellia pratensis TaxID=3404796 RepID=UPI003613BFA3
MSPISEDELRARLRSVEPSPAQSGFGEHLIHQGRFRRRRQRRMTGIAAAAAVVAIGGGAFVISDQLGPETALPATPTPTTTQSEITPTATSTKSPVATTTPSPRITGGTSTRPPSTSSPSSSPSRSVTLKPVTLLHEGDAGWVKAEALPQPCRVDGNPEPDLAEVHGVVETRTIRSLAEGDGASEALLVFPSAGDAVAYMGDVRDIARGCEVDSRGSQRGVVQSLNGDWGEGMAVGQAAQVYRDGQVMYMGESVFLAVRTGSGVAVSQVGSHGILEKTINARLIAEARPAVEHVVPQLCRYTKAGC